MGTRLPAPPPGTKCVCGHRYAEHVPGGDRHACQHGAEPPFTNLCRCNHFREKELPRSRKKVDGTAATLAPETPTASAAAGVEPSAPADDVAAFKPAEPGAEPA